MKQQISPKTAAIIIVVMAVIVLGIGYKVFFSAPSAPPPVVETPQNKRFMHPSSPFDPPIGAQSGQQPAQPSGQ